MKRWIIIPRIGHRVIVNAEICLRDSMNGVYHFYNRPSDPDSSCRDMVAEAEVDAVLAVYVVGELHA